MPTPLDTTRMAKALLSEDERPLVDRMTMLPIGQYEDGSLTLAWPQMLVDMYEGGVRSFEQGRQLPRVDSEGYYAGTPRAEPLDAFNAASAAPMAGVAGRVSGAVPKGALGSGGSDVMRVAANDANASAHSVALNALSSGEHKILARSLGYDPERIVSHVEDKIRSLSGSQWPSDHEEVGRLTDLLREVRDNPSALAELRAAERQKVVDYNDARRAAQSSRSVADRGDYRLTRHDDPYIGEVRYKITDHQGRQAGEAILSGHGDSINPAMDWVHINADHQRRGLATWLYDTIGEDIGRPLGPSGQLITPEIKAFWEKRAPEKMRLWEKGIYNANPETAAAPSIALNAMEKPQGIRAYHGSPHDFDKFSIDKIGAGEGAQVYGHGLYFAEKEGTARWYRERLAPSKGWGIEDGKPVPHVNDRPVSINEIPAYGQYVRNGGNLDRAIEDTQKRLAFSEQEGNRFAFTKSARDTREQWRSSRDEYKKTLDLLKQWRDQGVQIGEKTLDHDGRMYEVNINADPDKFLNWDTMPAEQQARLRTPEGAAEMRAQGVPGVRYLDAMSRTAGEGTHNYVVWDDSLIDIMRKYANPETAAAPSLLLNSEDGQQNPLLGNTGPDVSGYGLRPDGTEKGAGYFGELPRPDGGVSTELSMGVGIDGRETEIPLLVPSLDGNEVNWLLSNEPDPGSIPEPIVQKAYEHALSRISAGQNPFAQGSDLRLPPMTVPSHSMLGNEDVSTSDILRRYGLLSH